MSSTIKVLIVDDEKLARNRVKHMLKSYTQFEIFGECKNGVEAFTFLSENSADLIFLDIQMPEMTGLELVEAYGFKKFPAVIFVTAYDQHALKAFEYCAVDYLLKPFQKERFDQAIMQALHRMKHQKKSLQNGTIEKLIETTRPKILDRIFIKDSGLITILETDSIAFIESSGNYVTIHSKNKEYLHRQTMKSLELHLDPTKFARVHRSYIVQINKIKTLTPLTGGDYELLLDNKKTITLSRRYKENLKNLFPL